LIRKLALVAAEATAYFVLGIGLCIAHYTWGEHVEEFAKRWDGGCTGWTNTLVLMNVTGNLLLWWAYTMIGTTINRLHPVVIRLRDSIWTMRLVTAFIIGCGATHLVAAYVNFNPVYRFEARLLTVVAGISDVAAFFVAAGLIRVFKHVLADRARLAEYDRGNAK
jgi:hypothetical protein